MFYPVQKYDTMRTKERGYTCRAFLFMTEPQTNGDSLPDVKRDAHGRWQEKPPGTKQYEITHANARTFAEKRWAKHRAAIRQAVTNEMKSVFPTVTSPADAYAAIVAKQATTLLDSDKPRFDDVEKLGQIMGALPTQYDIKQGGPGANSDNQRNSSPILLVLAELRRRDAPVIIDAEENG